ncbi:MAG: glycosyl hydrolase 2 galactose-binding domain-containing protein [Opitutales bacterium]
MKTTYDLGTRHWTLTGYAPDTWRELTGVDLGAPSISEVAPIPADVPGSVQQALREEHVIPDWNHNLDSRAAEWVENRIWVFATTVPRAWLAAQPVRRLHCAGLDAAGWVCANGRLVGRFDHGFVPHVFDLSAVPVQDENTLQIVFDLAPRWLGQFNFTSQIKDWKARFNYTWDWQPRLVQIGIWDRVTLELTDGHELADLRCALRPQGFTLFGRAPAPVEVRLDDGGRTLLKTVVAPAALAAGAKFDGLPVEAWWPNGAGAQKTYQLSVRLSGPDGALADEWTRTVGFKDVQWRPCANAPAGADPWICVVNGRPIFLQGVNWTPIRPNYADVTREDYELRIRAYAELGCNVFRVWGGAFLETETFYDLCDRHGLLVWQEFPFSSSGIDNWPPEDPAVIAATAPIVRSYVARRQHHASLLCWCGGNELQGALDGGKVGSGRPTPDSHPLLRLMAAEVAQLDPDRRFLPTSPYGPRAQAVEADYGRELHWDIHGPWWPASDSYWDRDDSLFRSEVGAAGASPVDILERYYGPGGLLPLDESNPRWRRFGFWVQAKAFHQAHGRHPASLQEYVEWSQRLQTDALYRAALATKRRFPGCGGFIIWMGHDAFPCPSNTAVLDFWGRPKPAAEALRQIFRSDPASLPAVDA